MRSIQAQLRLLLIAFFLLVAISAGATFITLKLHASDAAVINFAGRQRMLIQQMNRLAIQIGKGLPLQEELSQSAQLFENSLQVLMYGGSAVDLSGETALIPQTKDDAVLLQLDQMQDTWTGYRSHLDALLNESAGSESNLSALDAVETLSPRLLSQADRAVSLFQETTDTKVRTLLTVQILFFLSAMGLLGTGRYITRKSLVEPLEGLGRSAEQIGKGDLSSTVDVSGPQEVQRVAQQIEAMRLELKASQGRLIQGVESLEEKVQHRTHELDALYQVSQEISAHLDVNRVLGSVTEKTRQLLDSETAILCLLENEQQVLSLQAYSGGDQTVKGFVSPVDSPTVQDTFTGKYAHNCTAHGCSGSCQIIADAYRASHMAAPLMVGNRITGALCIGSRQPDAFGEEASRLLTRLSKVAAVALENANLYTQAERVAALEERQRIAAEMHDGLAQTISYLGLIVDQVSTNIELGKIDRAAEFLEQAHLGLDRASIDVRQSIASLQDDQPPTQSIQALLRELVQEVSKTNPENIRWEVILDGENCLTPDDTRQVLGITREALLNACHHGGAKNISVSLQTESSYADLIIKDDGAGFTTGCPPTDGKQHFGLNILRARAACMNGKLEIESAPGAGTSVQLNWMMKENNGVFRRVKDA